MDRTSLSLVLLATTALAATACQPLPEPDDVADPIVPGDAGGGDGGAASCAPIDIATLTPCCAEQGGAHCLPTDQVPAHLRGALDPCPGGGLCVPDPSIAGEAPRSCASISGVAGACMSLCVPQVRNAANVLPTAGCGPTERCAPCVNPIDGTNTGACEVTACESGSPQPTPGDGGTGGDGGSAGGADCCNHAGTCVPIGVVGDRAAQLGVDVCAPNQGLVCVPDVYLDGTYTAPRCNTGLISLLLGAQYKPGACLPSCIPAVQQALFVGQDDCGTEFRCLPCLNPNTGMPSGACEPM